MRRLSAEGFWGTMLKTGQSSKCCLTTRFEKMVMLQAVLKMPPALSRNGSSDVDVGKISKTGSEPPQQTRAAVAVQRENALEFVTLGCV